MTSHLLRIAGITSAIVLCTYYPFFPGKYDGSALVLSTIAQLVATVGLLLVPIGVLWLAYEVKKRARGKRQQPDAYRGYRFAIAALIIGSIGVLAASLIIALGIGISVGVLTLALGIYAVSRLIPRVQKLKRAHDANVNPTPLYLLAVPTVVLLVQVALAARATEFSRNHAITNSAELINAIERHHAEHGRYPKSLLAVWKDYYPSVVGIEGFSYAPNGDAYNLVFEQPRLLFDGFGTREFVMYNKLDQHIFVSHAAWILGSPPAQLTARQGWYAVHDDPSPHWKYFWFD